MVAILAFQAIPTSEAADGDEAILGARNRSGARTFILGGGGLGVVSARSMKIASRRVPLELDARGDTPPLRVNSTMRVDDFNADLLDGMSSEEFLAADDKAMNADKVDGLQASSLIRGAFASTDDAPENWQAVGAAGLASEAVLIEASVDAPVDGMLQIRSGAAASFSGGLLAAADSFTCSLRVTGTDLTGTRRPVVIDDGESGFCETSGALFVDAGTQTAQLVVEGGGISFGGSSTFDDASLQVLFIPFAADGAQICVWNGSEPLCPVDIDPSLPLP